MEVKICVLSLTWLLIFLLCDKSTVWWWTQQHFVTELWTLLFLTSGCVGHTSIYNYSEKENRSTRSIHNLNWCPEKRFGESGKTRKSCSTGQQTLRDMFRGREAGRSPFVCTHRTQVAWRVRKLVDIRSGLWHKRVLQRGQLVRATCKTRHWRLSTNKNAAEFYATRGGDSRSEILCNNGHVTHAKKTIDAACSRFKSRGECWP